MNIWAAIGVFAGAYLFGALGFPQIVGSLQNMHVMRRWPFVIMLWAAILFGIGFLVFHFIPAYKVILLVGYGVSLVMTLSAGRIS